MTTKFEQIVAESKASQNPKELLLLLKMLDKIKPKVIVEIGVDQGYLLTTWRKAFDPQLLIGVELGNSTKIAELGSLRDATFIFGDSHHLYTKTRLQELLADRKIDLLFIDGDHTYEGVKQDFEMYAPLVREGGAIVLHDIKLTGKKWEGLVEVNRFWKELKLNYIHQEIWDQAGKGTGTGLIWV